MEGKTMKAYKGFSKDMTCREFQYEEGEEYHQEQAECCRSGFHACQHPLDCLSCYPPNSSVYHEVELSGKIDANNESDSKVAATDIKIGRKLDIAGLVKAAIEFVFEKTNKKTGVTEDSGASSTTGYRGASSATGTGGASSATGYRGASSATGTGGASSATGNYGASSATGDYGASSATGDYGASSATGTGGASSATGYYGASSATGYRGASSATGYYGASLATGYCGSSEAGNSSAVAIAWGHESKARGVIGAHLVIAEWAQNSDDTWSLKGAKMGQVDGETIKADTWYTLKNGEFAEVVE